MSVLGSLHVAAAVLALAVAAIVLVRNKGPHLTYGWDGSMWCCWSWLTRSRC
jgi:hypothetical protein